MGKLQFVGEIQAMRVGDHIVAQGTLQHPGSGAFIKAETKLSIPALVAYTKVVLAEAQRYRAEQGGQAPMASLDADSSSKLAGLGGPLDVLAKVFGKGNAKQKRNVVEQLKQQLARERDATKKAAIQRQLVGMHAELRKQKEAAQKLLQGTQTNLNRQISKLKNDQATKEAHRLEVDGLRRQLENRDLDDQAREELDAQANDYEVKIAQLEQNQQQSAMQVQQMHAVSQQAAAVVRASDESVPVAASQPTSQPTSQPASQPSSEGDYDATPEQEDDGPLMSGLGWGWSDIKDSFKKAYAITTRNQIIRGLVKVASEVPGVSEAAGLATASVKLIADHGGDIASAAAKIAPYAALLGVGLAPKNVWLVPGFNRPASEIAIWMRLLQAAQQGHVPSRVKLNRIKVMAKLGQPQAVKVFWMLRDIERLIAAREEIGLGNDYELEMDVSIDEEEPVMIGARAAVSRAAPAKARAHMTPAQYQATKARLTKTVKGRAALLKAQRAQQASPAKVQFKQVDPATGKIRSVPMSMAMRSRTPVAPLSPAARQAVAQGVPVAQAAQQYPTAPYQNPAYLSPQAQQAVAQGMPVAQAAQIYPSQPGVTDYTQGQYASQSYGQPQYGQPSDGGYSDGGDYGSMEPPEMDSYEGENDVDGGSSEE